MTAMAPRTVSVSRRPPTPSPVFDSYWRFAAMRQDIFHRRVRGEPGPWTTDPVLTAHRFTNAYRAADRVSQYMIRHVAYDGDPAPEEVVFRVLLFKLFNRIETWELLAGAVGPLIGRDFDVEMFDKVMSEAFARGDRPTRRRTSCRQPSPGCPGSTGRTWYCFVGWSTIGWQTGSGRRSPWRRRTTCCSGIRGSDRSSRTSS